MSASPRFNRRVTRVHEAQRTLKGTSRTTVGRSVISSWRFSAVSALLTLIVLPIVLRTVGAETFGLWSAISSIFAIAALSQGGISAEVGRRVAHAHGASDRFALRNAIIVGTTSTAFIFGFLFVFLVLLSKPIVAFIDPSASSSTLRKLTVVFIAAALLFCVSNILNAYFAVLSGLQRTDFANNGSLVGAMVGSGGTLLAALLGWGIWALLVGSALQLAVFSGFTIRGVRVLTPDIGWPIRRIAVRDAVSFIRAPLVLLFVELSNVAEFQFDKLVLAHYRGATATAYFQIGTTVALQLRLIAMAPAAVIAAATAELFRSDLRRLQRMIEAMSTGAYAMAGLLLGGGIVFGKAFIALWLGAKYVDAGLATQVLSLSLLVNTLAAPWYFYLVGRGQRRLLARSAIANVAANVACTVALTPNIGLMGALIGSLTGNLIGVWLVVRRCATSSRVRVVWLYDTPTRSGCTRRLVRICGSCTRSP